MSSAVKFGSLAAAFLVAAPAVADTRPMPDYFVSALVATSAAQSLALSCAELSVAPVAVPLVKDAVRSITYDGAKKLAREALDSVTSEHVLELCRTFYSYCHCSTSKCSYF